MLENSIPNFEPDMSWAHSLTFLYLFERGSVEACVVGKESWLTCGQSL